ncbi:hypothetical protein [Aeromonas hydrophila]|uniref:hypothetical protein n=1 Tax=Aeromonas hydrophila TaxID=644 RepID=UPI003D23D988
MLIVPLLILCLALWLANGRIERLGQSLLQSQADNRLLETINTQQADSLSAASRDRTALLALLGRQAAQLATLDDTTRSTTHALQHALAERPQCAALRLPDDALRLLKPPAARGDPADQGTAPGGADAGLPGA